MQATALRKNRTGLSSVQSLGLLVTIGLPAALGFSALGHSGRNAISGDSTTAPFSYGASEAKPTLGSTTSAATSALVRAAAGAMPSWVRSSGDAFMSAHYGRMADLPWAQVDVSKPKLGLDLPGSFEPHLAAWRANEAVYAQVDDFKAEFSRGRHYDRLSYNENRYLMRDRFAAEQLVPRMEFNDPLLKFKGSNSQRQLGSEMARVLDEDVLRAIVRDDYNIAVRTGGSGTSDVIRIDATQRRIEVEIPPISRRYLNGNPFSYWRSGRSPSQPLRIETVGDVNLSLASEALPIEGMPATLAPFVRKWVQNETALSWIDEIKADFSRARHYDRLGYNETRASAQNQLARTELVPRMTFDDPMGKLASNMARQQLGAEMARVLDRGILRMIIEEDYGVSVRTGAFGRADSIRANPSTRTIEVDIANTSRQYLNGNPFGYWQNQRGPNQPLEIYID